MSATVRIYLDEQPVDAPAGAAIRDIVAEHQPDLAGALDAGTAYVTDGVGRRIDPGSEAQPGAIFRVVRSARRPSDRSGS